MSADLKTDISLSEVLDRIESVSSSLNKIGIALSGNDSDHSLAFIFRGTPEAIADHALATRKLADAIRTGFSELSAVIKGLKS